MKILGKDENGDYIANVSHLELEKFLNRYYGNMEKMKPGDEIDLGTGHDFKQDIERALDKTQDFIQSNGKIITAILNGIQVANLKDGDETTSSRKGK